MCVTILISHTWERKKFLHAKCRTFHSFKHPMLMTIAFSHSSSPSTASPQLNVFNNSKTIEATQFCDIWFHVELSKLTVDNIFQFAKQSISIIFCSIISEHSFYFHCFDMSFVERSGEIVKWLDLFYIGKWMPQKVSLIECSCCIGCGLWIESFQFICNRFKATCIDINFHW